MAVVSVAVAVQQTAVKVSTVASDGVAHTVAVCALDGTVHVGGAGVSAVNGVPVSPGAPVTVRCGRGDGLFVVAGSGTVNVRVLRVGADS